MSESSADWSAQDRSAAEAVVGHHAQLSDEINRRTETLVARAETAPVEAERARADLLKFLRADLVPHAKAEEKVLYPAAAAKPAGKLLVDGMVAEHHTIVGLIEEIASAPSVLRSAAAARALAAVFATHLAKENDLVLPLLAGSPDVSLAGLLDGMHELLGAEAHGGQSTGGTAEAQAPRLTIDPRIDVRGLPHAQRHAAVLSALDAIAPGDALVLIAPHGPERLLAEVDARYGEQFTVEWLQSGPEVWQLRLLRAPARV